MTRHPAGAPWWTIARGISAALIVAAIVAQLVQTVGGAASAGRDVGVTIVNFFSFFTVLSNVLTVIVLVWAVVSFLRGRGTASVESRGLATSLACVTTYMLVTGVVYNTLLRGITLPQGTTVPWSNEVLHVVAPLFLLADLFLGPRRRALPWRAVAEIAAFPVLWVVYTLIRGPLTTDPGGSPAWWYPYPFLNPHVQPWGYGGVTLYVIGIAIGILAFATLVVWVGRRRGAVRA